MGKGSRTRPVDRDKFGDNYDRIFGKKKFNIHSSGKVEHIGPVTKQVLTDMEPKCYGHRIGFDPKKYTEGRARIDKGESDGSSKGNKGPQDKAGQHRGLDCP